jgi:prevent-host-death family protein
VNEVVFGVTDLRDCLPQVVDKAAETKRPMIITKHGRPVAAIIDVDELQALCDRLAELEDLENRQVFLEFEAAEARGDISWLPDQDVRELFDRQIAMARPHAWGGVVG